MEFTKENVVDNTYLYPDNRSIYAKYLKRWIDFVCALGGLIVLSPLLGLLYILTWLDVGSPVIFKQQRPGKDGKLFTIYKFRNMIEKFDDSGEMLPGNERVTRFGKFMRGTSLDELPQLYNILKGDMSIIGPRPMAVTLLVKWTPDQRRRLTVRPGLECPSMMKREHVRTYDEQFEDDVWYVDHLGFTTDCTMFLNLIKLVFNRKNSKVRANALRGDYQRGIKETYDL